MRAWICFKIVMQWQLGWSQKYKNEEKDFFRQDTFHVLFGGGVKDCNERDLRSKILKELAIQWQRAVDV